MGNSSDIVARVPTPGITPIRVPSATPITHHRRLFQANAVLRPSARLSKNSTFVSYQGQASTGTTIPKPILKTSVAPTDNTPPRASDPFQDNFESEIPARTVCTMIAGTRPKGTSSSANESVERLIQNNGRHSKVGSGPDRSRAEISIMTPQSANRPPTSAGK